MLHKSSTFLVLILFVGCMKIQKKGEANDAPVVASTNDSSPALPGPSNAVVSAPHVFDYRHEVKGPSQRVIFTLPEAWLQEVIVVEKMQSGAQVFQKEIVIESGEWSDMLATDSISSYQFFIQREKELVLQEDLDVLPALDLSVASTINLAKQFRFTPKLTKLHFLNLDIASSGQVLIEDFKGEVIIDHLTSAQGSLSTFTDEATASDQMDGRSVGNFNLRILAGAGSLNVRLIAESGRNGNPGQPSPESYNGTVGAEGAAAAFSSYTTTCGAGWASDLCIPQTTYSCLTNPGRGGKGQPGHVGHDGSPGGSGGSVRPIHFMSPPEVLVQIEKRAGFKGIGGAGAAGGLGGEGGRGGDGARRDLRRVLKLELTSDNAQWDMRQPFPGTPCPAGGPGDPGAPGLTGNRGNDGRDGVIY